MPVDVTMFVRLNQNVEKSLLNDLRNQIVSDLELEEGDFHDFSSFGYRKGPLVLVQEEDLPFMPFIDEKSIWLDVNLHGNYYGCGYERGNIALYVRCAEWLEHHLPGARFITAMTPRMTTLFCLTEPCAKSL